MTTGHYVERRRVRTKQRSDGGTQQRARSVLMSTVLLALFQTVSSVEYIDRECARQRQVSMQSCIINVYDKGFF